MPFGALETFCAFAVFAIGAIAGISGNGYLGHP
jgi:hypothetical protein